MSKHVQWAGPQANEIKAFSEFPFPCIVNKMNSSAFRCDCHIIFATMGDNIGFTRKELKAVIKLILRNKNVRYFDNNYHELTLHGDETEISNTSGTIRKVYNLNNHEECTINVVTFGDWRNRDERQVRGDEEAQRLFYQQLLGVIFYNLYDLKHPNIVEYYPDQHWIELPKVVTEEHTEELMEFQKEDSIVPINLLEKFIGTKMYTVSYWYKADLKIFLSASRDNGINSLQTARRLLMQVATGLGFLHDKEIVHGDLQPNNILVDEDAFGEVKAVIKDFSSSRCVEAFDLEYGDDSTGFFSSPPERMVSTKSDIWSFGHLIFYVCMFCVHGQLDNNRRLRYFRAMVNHKQYSMLRRFLAGLIPQEHDVISELIIQCVLFNPGDRPDCKLLLQTLRHGKELKAALRATDHINKFVSAEYPAQMVFPGFLWKLLERSDDSSCVRKLPDDIIEAICNALSQSSTYPVINFHQNCDVNMLNELAAFTNDQMIW